MTKDHLEALIAERFATLPPKLRLAARYVLDSPKEIAMQSMRSVAAAAKLQPSSMLRLARDLGFDSYEAFRAIYMDWLSAHDTTFVDRARTLSRHGDSRERLFEEMFNTEVLSLDRTLGAMNAEAFALARQAMVEADQVYIFGVRSLFPAAYYLDYACKLFWGKSTLITGVGGTIADELRRVKAGDLLVVFSFEPYARISIDAVRFAQERGARTIAVTDSAVSPVATGAAVTLLAPNASPSLLPSVLPAMAVAQALATLLAATGGAETLGEIADSQAQLRHFNVYAGR